MQRPPRPLSIGAAAARALFGDLGPRVVLYHHISSDPHPAVDGLGVTTPLSTFKAHLDYYARRYDVVGLDGLLTPPSGSGRRKLLITFDDCYRSVATVAAEALAERSMPSVFFVSSGPAATGDPLLDNVLCLAVARRGIAAASAAVDPQSPPATGLGQLIARLDRLPYWALLELRERVRSRLAPDEWAEVRAAGLYARQEDLRSLASRAMEVGSHTSTHLHTRSLSAGDVGPELIENKARLEAWTGRPVRSFSFPYGHRADATPLVLSSLRASGHRALFLVHALPNSVRPDLDSWYRVSLSDHPVSVLRRRIEILPRLRALRALRRPPA